MSDGADRAEFMRQALRVIVGTPDHPLRGLIDPSTGGWASRSPYTPSAETSPPVQAGHTWSRFAGGKDLALQDGFSNQQEGRFVESKGAPVDRGAIEIGRYRSTGIRRRCGRARESSRPAR
jgi:hypothetical protein